MERDFLEEAKVLILTIVTTFGIFLISLFTIAKLLDFLARDWVRKIKGDVEESTKKEWEERDS